MGTKNRQRRAEKARQRARAEGRRRAAEASSSGTTRSGPSGRPSHQPGAGADGRSASAPPGDRDGVRSRDEPGLPRFLPPEAIAEGLRQAGAASLRGDDEVVAAVLTVLHTQESVRVDREAEGELQRWIVLAWRAGWQPAEVLRQAQRRDARAGRLVAAAIAADHLRRAPDTLHPRWARQVAELGLPALPAASGWLRSFADGEGLDRAGRTRTVIEAMAALVNLGDVQVLIPPPGAGVRDAAESAATPTDDPVLVKVRALLAQAESTTYEAEAEAFTAKAQELMARHAIDAALVWGATERGERPVAIRLPLDDPYADAKAALLNAVAIASRCRTVLHDAYGLCTVIGFAPDLAATELLFTSLLVQSSAALQAEGAGAGPGARVRSRGFRSSFLLAYARRVGQRLRDVSRVVESVSDDEMKGSLLPVLADRDVAVEEAMHEMFTELRQIQRRGATDRLGWARGEQAADRADLNGDRIGAAAARPIGEITAA